MNFVLLVSGFRIDSFPEETHSTWNFYWFTITIKNDPKFQFTCCLNSGNVKFLSVNVLPMCWCTPEMLTVQLNLENSESFSTY